MRVTTEIEARALGAAEFAVKFSPLETRRFRDGRQALSRGVVYHGILGALTAGLRGQEFECWLEVDGEWIRFDSLPFEWIQVIVRSAEFESEAGR